MKDNRIEITDQIITRYLTGEATPEEALAMSEWIQTSQNKVYYQQLEAAWHQSAGISRPAFSKDVAWINIQKKVLAHSETTKPVSLWQRPWMKIAASVLIAVGIGSVFYLTSDDVAIKDEHIATTTESLEQVLNDRSRVTLNTNTAISYPKEFESHARKLQLEKGEAFFRVAPDKAKPFIIHTTAADIRVVGTEFNVVAKEASTEVSVREGVVLVYTAVDTVRLMKGDAVAITVASGAPISTENVANTNIWGYATRKLVFDDVPIKDAIRDIEKAYRCSIKLNNSSIEKCRLNATFDNDPVDKIVNLVADILNLTVNKNGNNFTLEGEGCP